jgi:hypothetical protein
MSRELTINGRLQVTENPHDHGTWSVYDLVQKKQVATSIRLVADLVFLIGPDPSRAEIGKCAVCEEPLSPVCVNPECTEEFVGPFVPGDREEGE